MHQAGLMNRFLDLSAKMASPVHWMLLLLFALELSIGGALVKTKTPLVTVEELRSLNASCYGQDTCRGRGRGYRWDDMVWSVNCQCGPYCVRYGTCCMDAPASFRGGIGGYNRGLNCSRTYGSSDSVFIVEKCPREWDGDDSVRDLCLANAEDYDDLLLLVPVSSLKTGITYRNYYCYLCNTVDDINDSFLSWNVKVTIYNWDQSLSVDLSTLTYDPTIYGWTFPGLPQDMTLVLGTEPPGKLLENFSIYCRNADVISGCAADWTYEPVRSKCGFYTALVYMRDEEGVPYVYRNVHCGICNWRSTEAVQCGIGGGYSSGGFDGGAEVFQEIFVIERNISRFSKCDEGQFYDKASESCRNFRCGKKMEKVKGRCVRKEE